MRITDIRETSIALNSTLQNSAIDFSEMTTSVVAVITDVKRDGRPIVGYAFTRMLSTPLDHQDVGNWACALGLVALFVEGVLVAVAAYAISLRRSASLESVTVRGTRAR